MRKCVGKTSDEGSFNSTHIAMSPDGSHLATGSYTGVVNVYNIEGGGITKDGASTGKHDPKPVKSIMNLTTAVSDLSFNHNGQLLAVCSKWKKNAVKLIHVPTCTVYQNFPGVGEGVLKYPLCLDFSHKSEFLALGNDEGKAHLFHLSHFSDRDL